MYYYNFPTYGKLIVIKKNKVALSGSSSQPYQEYRQFKLEIQIKVAEGHSF